MPRKEKGEVDQKKVEEIKKQRVERLNQARTKYNEKRKAPEKPDKRENPENWSKEYREWKEEVFQNQKKALAFEIAFCKDFNTAVAVLQEQGLVPRTPSRTVGGPVTKQTIRFCGAGKNLFYDEGTDRWSCYKASANLKDPFYDENYGPVKKGNFRKLSMEQLKALAYQYGISVDSKEKGAIVDALVNTMNHERENLWLRNSPTKKKKKSN